MNIIEKIEELNINISISSELQDFLTSGADCVSDYAHEYADNSADVIYYARAESLYSRTSSEQRDQAEQSVEDCGGFGEGKTMADRFVQLAYWITYNEVSQELYTELQLVIEEIEQLDDDQDELTEALEALV